MSVQFGRWNIDGLPVDREYLTKAGEMLAPYGPDGGDTYIKDNAGILYRAFHTTKESRKETQPLVTPSGAVLCWDGRLDNRQELVQELRGKVTADSTDLAVVAAAYEGCGTKSFAKLIGDWALSVWDPKSRSVILAKDPIGTRHLYYSSDQKQITWSTILDPLVLLSEKKFSLEEEYIAGWLSFFPATHLTPYVGIHSVPPCCFVRLEPGRQTTHKYWDFDPSKRIRYRTDGEYEEHFRQVFRESVRRRLRSDSPVLAELSGGMDSSSIVCMADTILALGDAETPRLDTVSYYDDSEPNWNERPYFTKVEEQRGRTGCHIRVDAQEALHFEFSAVDFTAAPGSVSRTEATRQIAVCLASQQNRIVLSGLAGDEVMGGVPTPAPEFGDLLAEAHLVTLARALKVWALKKRRPWIQLLAETLRAFFPVALTVTPEHLRPAPWLEQGFVKRHRDALTGYPNRLKIFGPSPSLQENLSTLETLRRQVGCAAPLLDPLLDKGYPYLDRDLLEFVYAVPRQQLVRPGERRSLMRRALAGIVPPAVLGRARKAFVARSPLVAVAHGLQEKLRASLGFESAALGLVNAEALRDVARKACEGKDVHVVVMIRTFALERWLLGLRDASLISNPRYATPPRSRSSSGNSEPMGTEAKLFHSDSRSQARGRMQRHFLLSILFLGGIAAIMASNGGASGQTPISTNRLVYHHHGPTTTLPGTLDPEQFKIDPTAFAAYSMAARIKAVLYQEPCYCPCNKLIGHESLLDCYRTTHAARCAKCKSEAVFCYLETRKGQSVEQIRDGLRKGKAWKLDLPKCANDYQRAQAAEKGHTTPSSCEAKRRAEKIQPEWVECP